MRIYNKMLLFLLVPCLVLSLLVGCTQETEEESPPANGDTPPTEEESQAQMELEALQAEYDQLSAEYAALEDELDAQKADYDELSDEYDVLNTQYENLNADYNDLNAKYAALLEPETFSNEEVEEILFDLINQERLNNGQPDLKWSDQLHWWATLHSEYMMEEKTLEYEDSDQIFWQDVFRGVSHGSAEKTAQAVMTMWQDNQYYTKNFLAQQSEYGAVAVVRSGEIFYITYFASMLP